MIKSELIAAIKEIDPEARPHIGFLKARLEGMLSELQDARARELALPPNVRIRSRQEVTEKAWTGRIATVTAMGRTVRGRVVDTVIRHELGTHRVALVIEHDQEADIRHGVIVDWVPTPRPRRTMHSFSHVKLSA